MELSDSDYERLLMMAYRNRVGDKPVAADGEKGEKVNLTEALTMKLIETFHIEETDLTQLARERAQRIKGYLICHGKIASERLYLLDVQIDDKPSGTSARTVLSLS